MLLTRFMDVCSCIPSLIYITLIMLLVGSGPLAIVLALVHHRRGRARRA